MEHPGYRKNDDGSFTLCDDPNDGCCVRVERSGDGFRITDDFGDSALLSKSDIAALAKVAALP